MTKGTILKMELFLFFYPYLNEIVQYKQQQKQKIENWIKDGKENLLKME